jgi:hypothetical protein
MLIDLCIRVDVHTHKTARLAQGRQCWFAIRASRPAPPRQSALARSNDLPDPAGSCARLYLCARGSYRVCSVFWHADTTFGERD